MLVPTDPGQVTTSPPYLYGQQPARLKGDHSRLWSRQSQSTELEEPSEGRKKKSENQIIYMQYESSSSISSSEVEELRRKAEK